MRYLLKLAARNLWRQKRRTFLTFMAIAVGLAALIEIDCLLSGAERDAIDNLINLETGDVRVHARGYSAEQERLPIDRTLDSEAVLSALRGLPRLKAATPRLAFAARLNTGLEELPVMGVGIDPELDRDVFTLSDYVEGGWPAPGAAEALLGKDLAQVLDLDVGDTFTLVTRTRDEALQALDLTVVGLISSPHPTVNNAQVFLPLDVASSGLNLTPAGPGAPAAPTAPSAPPTAGGAGAPAATEVVLKAERGVRAEDLVEDARAALERAGIQAEVVTWREAAQDFLTIGKTKQGFSALLIAMVLIIAVVGVVNTILLGAMERVREIGVMKAMGMTAREIVLLFMFEATGIGVLGSLAGCLVGIAGNVYLVNVGFDISQMYRGIDIGYPIAGAFRGAWNWAIIPEVFLLGVVVCWVASYFPAKRAADRDAIVALRQG